MSDFENPSESVSPVSPAASGEPYPFWDYKDLALFLGSGVPAILSGGLITRALFAGLSPASVGRATEILTAQFLGYIFWFFALYIILRTKYERPLWTSLAWINPWNKFWWHVVSGILLAIGVAIGALFLQAPDIDMPIKRLLTDRTSVLLLGLAAATIGPVCEELAFRGFLFPLLARSLGPVLGVILTAMPFALLHGPQYAWSWRHLLFIVLAGVAFGWKRYSSGSTAASAIMHAAYNLTFFAAFVFHGKDLPTKW